MAVSWVQGTVWTSTSSQSPGLPVVVQETCSLLVGPPDRSRWWYHSSCVVWQERAGCDVGLREREKDKQWQGSWVPAIYLGLIPSSPNLALAERGRDSKLKDIHFYHMQNGVCDRSSLEKWRATSASLVLKTHACPKESPEVISGELPWTNLLTSPPFHATCKIDAIRGASPKHFCPHQSRGPPTKGQACVFSCPSVPPVLVNCYS